MAILVVLFSFILFFVVIYNRIKYDFITAIIGTTICMSLFVGASSELLSIFNAFTFGGIFAFWFVAVTVLCVIILKNKHYLNTGLKDLIKYIKVNKWFFIVVSILVITLLFQGLIYPPNNWDSMIYHMARIPRWIADKNIDHYPTHIYWQIYQPPLAELWIAHVCILNRSDLFANAIQLFFLVSTLATIILICRELDFARNAKYIAILFICTTPEILLEASSTQNDIVVTFFLIATMLFCIRSYKSSNLGDILLLALTSGLACFTKGTAYIYLTPVLIVWLIFYLSKKIKQKKFLSSFKWLAIIPVMIIAINSGYYYRNIKLTQHPLGNTDDKYFNEKITPSRLLLGVIKNAGLHFGLYPFAEITDRLVNHLQDFFGIKINDPANNFIWPNASFWVSNWMHHEDRASNFFQAIIILLSLILILLSYSQFQNLSLILLFFPFLQFVFFCLLLKWTPWQSRLHTPIFCMFAVTTGYIFSRQLINKPVLFYARKILFVLMVIYAGLIIILNPIRPFFSSAYTSGIRIGDTRFRKYFANNPSWENEYGQMKDFLDTHKNKVAIIISTNTWEYPFYYDIYSSAPAVASHLFVNNPSRYAKWNDTSLYRNIEYIISTNKSISILYNDISYNNILCLPDFYIYKKTI